MEGNKKVILVVGGTGLVGNAIKKVISEDPEYQRPNEQWIFVGSKDGDLSNKVQTQALFEKHRPNEIINLAAIMGGVFFSRNDNLDIFRKNLFINDNVFHTAHEFGVKKIVSCLSTCIFPENCTYPVDESIIHDGEPHPSNYGYSYAKRMITVASRGYKEQYGHIYTSVIPCNIYGPHDNFHPITSNVIPGIIRKMLDAKKRGDKTYTVSGTGKPLRQFIYCEDLAKILIWALREYNEIEPLMTTVDMESEVSIAEVAETIKKCLKYDGTIVFDTSRPDGQLKKTASNKKLRSYLPNFKFSGLEESLQKTVDWYLANQDNARCQTILA